jgi:DUF4097 and DUF4098 domain-containing protein YvlB
MNAEPSVSNGGLQRPAGGVATFPASRASNWTLEERPARRPAMNYVTRCVLTIGFAFGAVLVGDAAQAAADISKVNGSVKVEPGQQAGDVSTVNGSVTIGAGARAEDVETVNGSLKIEDSAVVRSAATVNGSVTVGAAAQVEQGIDAVNGSLTLRRDARVEGGLENVNGSMLLEGAQVSGGIETVNGDIKLLSGTRLTGGIHVEQTKSKWNWGGEPRNPRITIEQGAIVEGPLHFEREVDLYVAPGVTLPPIEGVQPQRYTLQ